MNNKQVTIGVLAGIVLVFIFSSLVVEKRLSDAKDALRTASNEQELKVMTIAKDLGEGRAVEFAKSQNVITDCKSEESMEYDALLSALDTGLNSADLQNLKNLFNHCGSIPAASRAFMVYALEQEVETLEFLISQQELLGGSDREQIALSAWRDLVAKEKEVNTQFYALVAIQGKIIDALKSNSGEDIESIQSEAQVVQQKYAAAIAAASELRSTLVAS